MCFHGQFVLVFSFQFLVVEWRSSGDQIEWKQGLAPHNTPRCCSSIKMLISTKSSLKKSIPAGRRRNVSRTQIRTVGKKVKLSIKQRWKERQRYWDEKGEGQTQYQLYIFKYFKFSTFTAIFNWERENISMAVYLYGMWIRSLWSESDPSMPEIQ